MPVQVLYIAGDDYAYALANQLAKTVFPGAGWTVIDHDAKPFYPPTGATSLELPSRATEWEVATGLTSRFRRRSNRSELNPFMQVNPEMRATEFRYKLKFGRSSEAMAEHVLARGELRESPTPRQFPTMRLFPHYHPDHVFAVES
jgi:hypothetical protein